MEPRCEHRWQTRCVLSAGHDGCCEMDSEHDRLPADVQAKLARLAQFEALASLAAEAEAADKSDSQEVRRVEFWVLESTREELCDAFREQAQRAERLLSVVSDLAALAEKSA